MPLALGPDLRVILVDTAGAPLSVGGGTQYADGTVAATPTGNVVMWNDAGTVRAVSAAKPLPVAGVVSNNGAAPVALSQLGVLPAVANAAVPVYTEGRQGLLSMDLSGFARGIVQGTVASAASAVGLNPVVIGMNGAGALVRFFTEANAAAGTTGTGVVGTGPLIFDGTNYQKLKGDTSGVGLAIGTVGPAKAEDAGHTTGDVGVFNLAVRQDTQSALANTTLDYIPFTTDANGSLRSVAGGYTTIVTSSITRPADTNAYQAGDELSTSTSAPAVNTITGAARFSGGSGIIQGIFLSQSTLWTTRPALEIWIFDTTTTPNNDNAAFAPADADVDTCIGIVPLNSVYLGTINQGFDSGLISIPYLTVGSANLYFRVVVRNAGQDSANSGVSKFRFRLLLD